VLAASAARNNTQRPHRALQPRPARPESPVREPVSARSGVYRSSAAWSMSVEPQPENRW